MVNCGPPALFPRSIYLRSNKLSRGDLGGPARHSHLRVRHSSATAGFMLIELGIVVALFAIIVGIGISSFGFLHRQLVRVELEQLYSRVCYLQARAIATNREHHLYIDPATQSYQIEDQRIYFGTHVKCGACPSVMGPPSHPTQQIIYPVTFPGNKISFYPDGTMQAGAVYLTDQHERCLFSLTIPVGATSCIRKYLCDKSVWTLLQ